MAEETTTDIERERQERIARIKAKRDASLATAEPASTDVVTPLEQLQEGGLPGGPDYEETPEPTPPEERGIEKLAEGMNIDRMFANAPVSFRNSLRGKRDMLSFLPMMAGSALGLPSESVRRVINLIGESPQEAEMVAFAMGIPPHTIAEIRKQFRDDESPLGASMAEWNKEPLWIGEEYAKTMIDAMYLRARNFRQTMEEDPFGAAEDVASLVQPAGRLATVQQGASLGRNVMQKGARRLATHAATPLRRSINALSGYFHESPVGQAFQRAGEAAQRTKVGIGDITSQFLNSASAVTTGGNPLLMKTIRGIARDRKVEPEDIARTGGNFRDAYHFDVLDREGFLAARRIDQPGAMGALHEDVRRTLNSYYQRVSERYEKFMGEMTVKDPLAMARDVDDLKLSLLDELKKFRIKPKGRNIRVKGQRVGDIMAGKSVSKSEILPGLRKVVEESKKLKDEIIVYMDPVTDLPISEAVATARNYDLASLKSQTRPGRARSLRMDHIVDLGPEGDKLRLGGLSPGSKADFNTVVKLVLEHEDITIPELHALKESLADLADASTVANPASKGAAFATRMKDRVSQVLNKHAKGNTPEGDYANVMKEYNEMMDLRREAASMWSLDAKNKQSAANAIFESLTDDPKKEAQELLLRKFEFIDDGSQSWQQRARLRATIAGIRSRELFGRGLIGRSIGASALGIPAAAGVAIGFGADPAWYGMTSSMLGASAFAFSSPRAVSKLLAALEMRSDIKGSVLGVIRKVHEGVKLRKWPAASLEGLSYAEVTRRLFMTDQELEVHLTQEKEEELIDEQMTKSGAYYNTANQQGQQQGQPVQQTP